MLKNKDLNFLLSKVRSFLVLNDVMPAYGVKVLLKALDEQPILY